MQPALFRAGFFNSMQLRFPHSFLDLDVTRVMGVLNVTPDSFSDGGLYAAHDRAAEHALAMLADGADIIDIGGESTRPGAQPVSAAQEIDRVVGVVEALRCQTAAPLSIDTSKPQVMQAALAAGASMINDVRALGADGAIAMAVQYAVPVCLMHMQGQPRTMQTSPQYGDVVAEVSAFLRARAEACVTAGVSRDAIVIDPGFGFGKTLAHNLTLLQGLDQLVAAGYPLLAGLSRKSLIPAIMQNAGLTQRPQHGAGSAAAAARDRIGGSVTLALYAARAGAHIVRVHDVRETVEALTIQRTLSAG